MIRIVLITLLLVLIVNLSLVAYSRIKRSKVLSTFISRTAAPTDAQLMLAEQRSVQEAMIDWAEVERVRLEEQQQALATVSASIVS